jgi:hypothetical protein
VAATSAHSGSAHIRGKRRGAWCGARHTAKEKKGGGDGRTRELRSRVAAGQCEQRRTRERGGGPVGEEAGEWSADMRAPQYSNGRRRFDLIQISNLNELKFDSNCSNLTDPKGTFPSLIFKNKMWL